MATDGVGNYEALPQGDGDALTVYDTAPPASQAAPPAGPVGASAIAVPWTASDALSGIATGGVLLRYSFEGSEYADGPTASGGSGTFQYTPSRGGGTYCFYTVATDLAGNVEAPPEGPDGDGCTLYNTPPVAVEDAYSTAEDTALFVTAPGVLGNDVDPDGDALTAVLATGPVSGSLTLVGTGSFLYRPTRDFSGVVRFTYHANDGIFDSLAASVTITVTAVNDAPVAEAQTAITYEDTALPFALTADDVDGDPLTFSLVSLPAHGSLSGDLPNLTYIPDPDYTGRDSFTFKANDGALDSNVATVSITVHPVGDAPIALDQSVSTEEDVPVAITLDATDADGDRLEYTLLSFPVNGSLSGSSPNLTYTPDPDYAGSDSFSFKANDGALDSNAASVTISVAPVNDAPAFTSVPLTGAVEGETYTYEVAAADVDSAPAALTLTAPILPGWLTLTDHGDGTATLEGIPAAAEVGDHPVVLQVFDGAAAATQSFAVTVSVREIYFIYLPVVFVN
jgi:hypothetical protein